MRVTAAPDQACVRSTTRRPSQNERASCSGGFGAVIASRGRDHGSTWCAPSCGAGATRSGAAERRNGGPTVARPSGSVGKPPPRAQMLVREEVARVEQLAARG